MRWPWGPTGWPSTPTAPDWGMPSPWTPPASPAPMWSPASWARRRRPGRSFPMVPLPRRPGGVGGLRPRWVPGLRPPGRGPGPVCRGHRGLLPPDGGGPGPPRPRGSPTCISGTTTAATSGRSCPWCWCWGRWCLAGGCLVIQSIFRISIQDKIQSYGQLRTPGGHRPADPADGPRGGPTVGEPGPAGGGGAGGAGGPGPLPPGVPPPVLRCGPSW